MYSEDELLPISALQHLAFCERQAALIHIENVWEENVLTAEGRIMHERTHSEEVEIKGNVRISRGLRMRSLELGLVGMADVVEFHRLDKHAEKMDCVQLPNLAGWWKPYIVEYKYGGPKPDPMDEVQLCAQAICLEEMLSINMSSSSFFYGRPRRRHIVQLNQELRDETRKMALRLHEMVKTGRTPSAVYTRKCHSCSLSDVCMPRVFRSSQNIATYLHKSVYTGEMI